MSTFQASEETLLRFILLFLFLLSPDMYKVKGDGSIGSVLDDRLSFEGKDEMSSSFWIWLTQAQLNIVIKSVIGPMNESVIPQLDPLSLIIKPAIISIRPREPQTLGPAFVSKVGKSCSEAVENTQMGLSLQKSMEFHNFTRANASYYSTLLRKHCVSPNYDGSPFVLQDAPKGVPRRFPVFHCNQYIEKADKVIVYFRMEYPNCTTPLPSNLKSDLIPIYFLVEIRKASSQIWEKVGNELQVNWIFSVNVTTNQSFHIRVTAISTKYVYPPTNLESMTICDPSLTLDSKNAEMNLQLIKISQNGNGSSVSALLRWTSSRPSKKHQASCDYDVFYMDEEVCKIKRKSGKEAFWALLAPLKFGQNYNVRIIEKFRRLEEGNVSEVISSTLQIAVPTCLELYHFSFKFCPPPPPLNVRWGDPSDNSISIKWDPPKYSNVTSNPILYYNVTVEWIYPSVATAFHPFPNYNTQKILAGTVPGNVCSVLVPNVTRLRGQFNVYVKAVGPAGASKSTWNILDYKGSPQHQDSNDSKTWTVTADPRVFLLVFFGLIASFLSLLLLHMGIICILKRLPQQQHDQQFQQHEMNSLSSHTRTSSSFSFVSQVQSSPNTRKV